MNDARSGRRGRYLCAKGLVPWHILHNIGRHRGTFLIHTDTGGHQIVRKDTSLAFCHLSTAKDLYFEPFEILRCIQNDNYHTI